MKNLNPHFQYTLLTPIHVDWDYFRQCWYYWAHARRGFYDYGDSGTNMEIFSRDWIVQYSKDYQIEIKAAKLNPYQTKEWLAIYSTMQNTIVEGLQKEINQ